MKFLKFITDYMSVGVLLFGILGALFPSFFQTFKSSTPYLLGFVMFGMGLGLSYKDFYNVITNPKAVLFGILMQFIMMPILALLITVLTPVPLEFAVGILLVGCCPGGTASNVLTYLAKGNVALSVSITICTTLLSPVLTPFIFYYLAHNTINIDVYAIMWDIIKMVILPVFIGVTINAILKKVASSISKFMPFISSLTIMIIVGIVCSLSGDKLASSSLLLLFAIFMHNLLGILLSYFVSKLLRFSDKDSRTLAIEVGTQNSGLGAVLAMQHLTAFAAAACAIFSVMQNIIGSLFASFIKSKDANDAND